MHPPILRPEQEIGEVAHGFSVIPHCAEEMSGVAGVFFLLDQFGVALGHLSRLQDHPDRDVVEPGAISPLDARYLESKDANGLRWILAASTSLRLCCHGKN